mmetsp:Transcript_27714/g.34661  ORF Transcript_27714/g.34661 Transcript_27714/m.34661 type:complete len:914 (+) Transcript_27714:317-3058(+)
MPMAKSRVIKVAESTFHRRERASPVNRQSHKSSIMSESSICTTPMSSLSEKLKIRRKKKMKLSPRFKLAISFFFSQAAICGIFFLNFFIFSSVMMDDFLYQAEKELNLMEWTYDIKINQMGFGFRAKIRSASILQYLKTGNDSSYDPIREELQTELSNRQIEYATLLDSSGRIVVSANNNRSGEHWDPAHLTSLVKKYPELGQIKFSAIASFSELQKEGIPLYRERLSDDQPLPLTHPTDTSKDAVVRYTFTPIVTGNNSALLGIIVSGDIANGKTPITFRTVDSYGAGFSGLYMISEGEISRCTSSYVYQIPDSDETELSSTFDPTSADFLQEAFLIEDRSTIVQHVGSWSLAAKRIFNKFSTYGPPRNDSVAPVAIVRGVYHGDSHLYEKTLNQNLFFLICVIVTDFLMFLLSLALYIRPLEDLARRLKKKKSVMENGDEIVETFAVLESRAKYLFLIFLPIHLMKSVLLSILMIFSLRSGLRSSQGLMTYSAMGVKNVMYKIKIDQMSFGFAGNTKNTAIRGLLDAPSNTDLKEQVNAVLETELSVRKIEFAVMVDANTKILVNPNGVGLNGTFDPEGLASLTLSTGLRHKQSAILPYDVLANQNVPTHQEHVDQTLGSSELTPLTSKSPSLIRYTTSPIYALSNVDGKSPDGVLISGDIMNGKTALCERVLHVMSTGYCGVYIKEDSDLLLITSVFKSSSTAEGESIIIDYDLAEKDFLAALVENPTTGATSVQNLFGQKYIFAADAIPQDTYITSFGEFDDDREVEFAFVVYASSLKTQVGFWLWFGMSIQIFGIVLSGILSSIVTYMAFKPVQKLLQKVGKLVNLKVPRGGTQSFSVHGNHRIIFEVGSTNSGYSGWRSPSNGVTPKHDGVSTPKDNGSFMDGSKDGPPNLTQHTEISLPSVQEARN